jgi:hypothetical protein
MAYVCDPANVLTGAGFGGMVEKERVKESDERTSLSTICLITNSEFRDGRLSGASRDDSCFCHIEMSAELVTFKHFR